MYNIHMYIYIYICIYAELGKLRTCIRDVLKIISFRNCHTSLFFNKFAHEHTF